MEREGDIEAKYRLSDGRDAVDVAKALEEFSEKVRQQPESRLERLAGSVLAAVWNVESNAAHGAFAFKRELQHQLEGLSDDDKEILLRVTNERQWSKPRLPETMPDLLERAQLRLKADVTFGEDHGKRLVSAVQAIFGVKQDTRDAATMAEAFLARVQGLQRMEDRDIDEVFAQARQDVLDGVPDHYRAKVVDRIVAREEELLAADGNDTELAEMVDSRDARRERGWRAVLERPTATRGRTR